LIAFFPFGEIADDEFEERASGFAKKYFETFNICINNGRTEAFSHLVANEVLSDFSIFYAILKIELLENEIRCGKDKEYADCFSSEFASNLINAGLEMDSDEETIEWHKIKARVKTHVHFKKTANEDKYYEIYESEYVNYYFNDNGECKDQDFTVHEFIEKRVEEKFKQTLESCKK